MAYMFSAHCLFGMTLPNNSAGESRNGNGFFQDGGRTKKIKEHPSPWSDTDSGMAGTTETAGKSGSGKMFFFPRWRPGWKK